MLIYKVFYEKNWFILKKVPYLKEIIPKKPRLIFRRAPTLRNMLVPSKLKQQKRNSGVTANEKMEASNVEQQDASAVKKLNMERPPSNPLRHRKHLILNII